MRRKRPLQLRHRLSKSTAFNSIELTRSEELFEYARDVEWRAAERDGALRAILDSLPDVVISRDHDGLTLFANRAFCQLFALHLDDIQGTRRPELMYDNMPENAAQGFVAPISNGYPTNIHAAERVETAFGLRWLCWTTTRCDTADGGREFLTIGRDVTELRDVIQKLEDARDQACAANRAKSRFLAAVSHEIRTPLNGILGMSVLLDTLAGDDDPAVYIEAIKESARLLVSLIDETLDFATIESGKLKLKNESIDVRSLLGNLKTLLRPKAASKNLHFDVRVSDDVPDRLMGDAARLRQIAINLTSNAIKFTERGRVDIVVDYLSDASDPGGVLQLSVIDTGVGLRQEELQSIFIEFSQGEAGEKNAVGGSGLGLAISQRLAEAMSGELSVSSEWGGGSTFTLRLPMPVTSESPAQTSHDGLLENTSDVPDVARVPEKREVRDDVCVTAKLSQPCILIAEDNAVNLLLAERIVSRLGCRVMTAGTGLEAVRTIQASLAGQGPQVDLVLMDMLMPVMDGLQAANRIRQIEAARFDVMTPLPIVGLTANAYREHQQACRAAGMTDFLAKPFDPIQLTEVLRRCLPYELAAALSDDFSPQMAPPESGRGVIRRRSGER